MTKRNLTVISLLIQILSGALLFKSGCFHYEACYNEGLSFFKRLVWEKGGFFIVIAYIVLLTIAFNCLCSFVYIFKNVKFINNKSYILLSVLTMVAFIFAYLFTVSEIYLNPSSWYYGDFEQLSIELFHFGAGGTFYLECVVLLFNILIECAKHFVKMPYSKENIKIEKNTPADELKKYKELLDSGAITQEEFDEKKSKLLNS